MFNGLSFGCAMVCIIIGIQFATCPLGKDIRLSGSLACFGCATIIIYEQFLIGW
jgi:hypothetical protein